MKNSLKRSEIQVQYTWKVEDIYSSTGDWEEDFKEVNAAVRQIQMYQGHLGKVDSLKECFEMFDNIYRRAEKLYSYAYLKYHTDMTDSTAHALVNRIDKLMIDLREKLSFIDPEILSYPEQTITGLIGAEQLAFYKFSLEKIVRLKPHTLPKDQEEIVARAGILSRIPQSVFSMLNDADMKFPAIVDEENNVIELTHARYGTCLESQDRRVRKDAYYAHYSAYRKQQHTISSLFDGNIQKDLFYARTLHYPSCLSMGLFDDKIPVEVYDQLIQTVHKNLPVFQRYLRLRKKVLGVSELHLYDLSVPLVREVKENLTYDEAQSVVGKALSPLGDEYMEIVSHAFQERWIDVYESEGKQSGGYSWGVYGVHPYILLNYEGTVHDLFTIAHEIGHTVHSHLSNRFQEYRYASYSIFIAEIASTLNEALLLRYLLDTASDTRYRTYLLTHFADNFRGTVIVQTLFAEFEKIIHDLAERSVPLTLDKINEIYLKLHSTYYGDEVIFDPDAEIGWMRIPHFYQSFYVYKYATGFSAAQYLAHKITSGETTALERYRDLLKCGGRDFPLELLRKAGIDMSSPVPIENAFKKFEQTIVELEKLLIG